MVTLVPFSMVISTGLNWLGDVVLMLASTGIRIGELASLQWGDIDMDRKVVTIRDESRGGSRSEGTRTTKNHRDRSIPLGDEVLQMLAELQTRDRSDDRVFHGPRGGKIKPDTVRNIFLRDVIGPLQHELPRRSGSRSIADGRIHSFRHYFCSQCANNNVPEQLLMKWLGHSDSKMVRHYYHANDDFALSEMQRLDLSTSPTESATTLVVDAKDDEHP